MSQNPKEPLPIGRAALAKIFCAEWIILHGKTVFYSFLTLVVLSVSLFQLTGRLSSGSKSDYLEIQKAVNVFLSKEEADLKALKELEKPLKRHPELQTKFGNQIAQHLLTLGEGKKASPYISASLKRTKEFTSPYYSRFTLTTLAISNAQLDFALEEAKRLKADLEQDEAFWQERDKYVRSGTVLYAYNLLRIAILEGQVGTREGELLAWDELIKNAGWDGIPRESKMFDPNAYALLAQNFTQGDISLLDYIKHRKKNF